MTRMILLLPVSYFLFWSIMRLAFEGFIFIAIIWLFARFVAEIIVHLP